MVLAHYWTTLNTHFPSALTLQEVTKPLISKSNVKTHPHGSFLGHPLGVQHGLGSIKKMFSLGKLDRQTKLSFYSTTIVLYREWRSANK